MFTAIIKNLFSKIGLDIRRADRSFFTLDKDFKEIYDFCRPYTMTSLERMYALYKACEYIAQANVFGDLVECGVWKGGSAMLAALTLKRMGRTDIKIRLYDTYEGMTEPAEVDISAKGERAQVFFSKTKTYGGSNWCHSSLDEVRRNLSSTGYPQENIIFVKGKVQDTLPANASACICLLRLDTDWYESTYHEMKYLYPLLSPRGVLVLDDYGYWQGAKKAVDQYLSESQNHILLNKIDFSGRIGIKC